MMWPFRRRLVTGDHQHVTEKMRFALGVWSVIARETFSAVVKPTREIDELASDVTAWCPR